MLMRANGYGADLELTAGAVVIHAGKATAKLQGTDTITIPLADVAGVDYRPATMLVNGSIRLHVKPPEGRVSLGDVMRARHDDEQRDAVQQAYLDQTSHLEQYGATRPNRVNPESLVVHWRRKDQAAFEALRDAIDSARH